MQLLGEREFYFSAASDFLSGGPGQKGLDALSEVLSQHNFNISITQ